MLISTRLSAGRRIAMKYKCTDCKDRGFITLLTSMVECDCRASTTKPGEQMPHWVAAYDSYGDYVAGLRT